MKKILKSIFVLAFFATVVTAAYLAWTNRSDVLLFDQEFIGTKPKEAIAADLRLNDKQVLSESVNKYEVKDSAANGVEMRTASTTKPEEYFTATFPKAYNLPMTIDIGQGRVVEMVDKTGQIYEPELIYDEQNFLSSNEGRSKKGVWEQFLSSPASAASLLSSPASTLWGINSAREGDPA